MFELIAYLAPILLVGALVLGSRLPLLHAGACGLAATLLAALLAPLPYWPLVLTETLRGAWLALFSAGVMLAGLVFHHALQDNTAQPEADATPRRPHLAAFILCFIAGPLVESAIGFGVGFAVSIGGLLRLGFKPLPAALLSLISQMLVPWGALAIGTLIGAALAQLPLSSFGLHIAYATAPVPLLLLGWFWQRLHRAGLAATGREYLIELALVLALIGLLILGNASGAVDAAGLLATAPLLALLYWRETLSDRVPWRLVLPYGLLIALLLPTRLLPGLSETLRPLLAWQPWPDMPALPPFYYTGTLLLLTALATLLGRGEIKRLPEILRRSWRGGRIAVLSTLIFLVMARLYTGAGMAEALARGWGELTGAAAPLGSPAFAALAGWLTGSNTASNSLLLPIQVALAQQTGLPLAWLAGLQSSTASLISCLFAGKLALACAFAGIPGQERRLLRAALPYAALMLLPGFGLAAALLLIY